MLSHAAKVGRQPSDYLGRLRNNTAILPAGAELRVTIAGKPSICREFVETNFVGEQARPSCYPVLWRKRRKFLHEAGHHLLTAGPHGSIRLRQGFGGQDQEYDPPKL
jgi:hypothetical protein